MRRRGLRVQLLALALGLTVLATAGVMTVNDRALDLAADTWVRNQIREIARLDAELDAEMLKGRDGLAVNYDALMDIENALKAAFEALRTERIEAFTADPAIGAAFEALRDHLSKKGALLDDIKFRHAVVVNSSRYFPKALADIGPRDGAVADGVRDLERAALAYSLEPGVEEGAAFEAVATRLLKKSPWKDDAAVHRAATHAEKIATSGPSLDEDAKKLVALPTATDITELMNAYAENRRHLEERSSFLHWGLVGASLALFAATAYVLRQLAKTNASARRFVPYEFLDALGKGSLAEIKRGDAVKKEMSVVFSDIRDFTTTSEKRSPEDNFKFMNEYLGTMEKPIGDHRGFVNQYLGDGIMALFPRSADDALGASIEMFRALEALNRKAGSAVRISVGINTGNLMLGTMGGRDRMNAGVISDAVNLASRIEGLTRRYDVRMLVSEHTKDRLTDAEKHCLRTVDRVLVKGAQRPVMVYEVVDADDHALREQKKSLLATHERAVEHYFARRFAEALPLFLENQKTLPDDRVTALFVERCNTFACAPPPPTWNGVAGLEIMGDGRALASVQSLIPAPASVA